MPKIPNPGQQDFFA